MKSYKASQVARFLLFALRHLGRDVPQDVRDDAISSEGDDSKLERNEMTLHGVLLCMGEQNRMYVVHNQRRGLSRELSAWWDDYRYRQMGV